MSESNILIDSFGRMHNYLRISLTPHCNLRCFYCMPKENYEAPPASSLMQPDEIDSIVKTFVQLGVNKIRLTGGEPLVRKDAAEIITTIARHPVKLAITTNGVRIHHFNDILENIGIQLINISLDTLVPEKFEAITRRNYFAQVWQNIESLLEKNIPVKLNTVVMKGINDNELLNFVALTKNRLIDVRFIEYMPFDGNSWQSQKVVGWQQILQTIGTQYEFYSLKSKDNDTAKSYRVHNHIGSFSIISTMTAPFCSTCNRIRLTADGKLKNCLFSKNETDILSALRQNMPIEPLIRNCIQGKKAQTGGQFETLYENIKPETLQNRSMINIGG